MLADRRRFDESLLTAAPRNPRTCVIVRRRVPETRAPAPRAGGRAGRGYDGIYTVTDTGREIKGRELDLYLDDCAEAQQFGRRAMRVAVIRRGWDPAATPGSPAVTQRR